MKSYVCSVVFHCSLAQLPWKLVSSAHLTAGSAPSGQDIEVAVVSFVWKIQMFLSE